MWGVIDWIDFFMSVPPSGGCFLFDWKKGGMRREGREIPWTGSPWRPRYFPPLLVGFVRLPGAFFSPLSY